MRAAQAEALGEATGDVSDLPSRAPRASVDTRGSGIRPKKKSGKTRHATSAPAPSSDVVIGTPVIRTDNRYVYMEEGKSRQDSFIPDASHVFTYQPPQTTHVSIQYFAFQ